MIFKRYLLKFTVFFIALFSFLILCEIGIRNLYPKYDPSGRIKFEYNKDFNIRIGKKNYSGRQIKNTGDYDTSVTFNKYGFRDDKDVTQINPQDLLVVGDSYSLGWGVENDKRYSDQLQKLINKPVYNISISNNLEGYKGLIGYAESNGAKIENVILGFCMENDLLDYGNLGQRKIKDYSATNKISYTAIKNYLSNFALFNLFTAYIHSNTSLRNFAVKSGLIIDNLGGIAKNEINDQTLRSSVAIIKELNNKYNLLVIIIASRGLWAGKNKVVENEVHIKFTGLLRENKIDFIDLRKSFEAGGSPLNYHFENDGHWNENGHYLSAKEIYDYLKLNCVKSGAKHCLN